VRPNPSFERNHNDRSRYTACYRPLRAACRWGLLNSNISRHEQNDANVGAGPRSYRRANRTAARRLATIRARQEGSACHKRPDI